MSSSFFDNLNPIKHILTRILKNKYVNSQGVSTANLTNVHLKDLSLNTFHINKDLLSFSPFRVEHAVIGEFQISLHSMSAIKILVKDLDVRVFCNEDLPPNAFMEDFIQKMAYLSTEEIKNSASNSGSVNSTFLNILARFTINVELQDIKVKIRLTRPTFQAEALGCPLHSSKCPDHSLNFEVKNVRLFYNKAKKSSEFEVVDPNEKAKPQDKNTKVLPFKLRIRGLECFRTVISPLVKLNAKVKKIPVLMMDPDIRGSLILTYNKDTISSSVKFAAKDILVLVDSHNVGFFTSLVLKATDFGNARLALKNLNSFKEEQDLSSQNQSIIYKFNQSLLDQSDLMDKSFIHGDKVELFTSQMESNYLRKSKGGFKKTKTIDFLDNDSLINNFDAENTSSSGDTPKHSQIDLLRLEQKCQSLLRSDADESSLSIDTRIMNVDLYKSSMSKNIFTKSFSNKQTLNRSDISEVGKHNNFSKKKKSKTSSHKFKLELGSFYLVFVSDGITSDLNDLLTIGKAEGFLKISMLNNIQVAFHGISVTSMTEVLNCSDGNELIKQETDVIVTSADSRIFFDQTSQTTGSVNNFSSSFSLNMNSFDNEAGHYIFQTGERSQDELLGSKDILKGLNSTVKTEAKKAKPSKITKLFSLKVRKGFHEETPRVFMDVTEPIQINFNSILLVFDLLKEALLIEKDYFKVSKLRKELIRKGSIKLLRQEKSLYFENFEKSDLDLIKEWATKFLSEFDNSKESFIDLLQSVTAVIFDKIIFKFVSKESSFALTLDKFDFGMGDGSRQYEEQLSNRIDIDIKDIIEITNKEMRDTSLSSKGTLKMAVSRVYIEYFRHQANLKPDLRLVLSGLEVLVSEKMSSKGAYSEVKVNVEKLAVETLVEGLTAMIETLLSSSVEFHELFKSSEKQWEVIKVFFFKKFQKLYLNQSLYKTHQQLTKVVNKVLALAELETNLIWNVGKINVELLTTHQTRASPVKPSFKKKTRNKYISDMTFLVSDSKKTSASLPIKNTPFKFIANFTNFAGQINELSQTQVVKFAKFEFKIVENENIKLLDSLFYSAVNNFSLEVVTAKKMSAQVKIGNCEVYLDLFESRISMLVNSFKDIFQEIHNNCQNLEKLITEAIRDNDNDQSKDQGNFQKKSSPVLNIQDIMIEPFDLKFVINDYSFSYQCCIHRASLASGTLLLHKAAISRISFLDSSSLSISSLWNLKDLPTPKNILMVEKLSFKVQKNHLSINNILLNLPLHIIKELDCYSNKVDFLIMNVDVLSSFFGQTFTDAAEVSEMQSVYQDMESQSINTDYQSMYRSFGKGKNSRTSLPNEQKAPAKKIDHSFELLNPSFKKLFGYFAEYVRNSNASKENGGSGIHFPNLKHFISQQNTKLKHSFRVFVNSIRLKIQMPTDYFSLSVQDCFYSEMIDMNEDFPVTQSVIQFSSFSFKNASLDIPLLTSSANKVCFNLLLSRSLNSHNVQFTLHVSPLNFYLAHIRKVFPQIYEFLLFLQNSQPAEKKPDVGNNPPLTKMTHIQSGITSSMNYIKSKFKQSEESSMEESLNTLLTQSLSSANGFELIPYEFEEEPETHFTDFHMAPLNLKFFKKSSSLECIEIVTRTISPENDIKFDQSSQALLRLIISSIKADLWENKSKLWNLRSLNFVLLLANIITVIVSKSHPTTKLKSFSKKSIKKFKKKAFKMFQS